MDKYFLNYDEALIMREIGFNEPCFKVANSKGRIMWRSVESGDKEHVDVLDIIGRPIIGFEYVAVPTYWQALDYLEQIGMPIKYGEFSLQETLKNAIREYYRSGESDLL